MGSGSASSLSCVPGITWKTSRSSRRKGYREGTAASSPTTAPVLGAAQPTAALGALQPSRFSQGRCAEAVAWWEPTGRLPGAIVLTPVSAPWLTASLQPSASAESKSRGEQLVAQMCAPPAPAGAGGCTPTPFPASPRGSSNENPSQTELTESSGVGQTPLDHREEVSW